MTDLEALRRDGVLLVTQQLAAVRSGVGTYARTILGGLRERGVPLVVATWDDECDPGRFRDVDYWRLGRRPRLDPTPGAFWTLGRRAAAALRAGTRRFAVVHFLDAREGHATLGDSPLRGRAMRFVGTVHDDYAVWAPHSPLGFFGQAADPLRRWAYYAWLRRLERRTLPAFDHLAANSAATLASITREYGCRADRCSVVPLTIDAPPAVAPAPLAGTPRLLFVGGNFFRKGLDAVLDALPALRATHPRIALHVAGHDPAQAVLARRAARLGVANAVVWHGRVDAAACAAMFASASVLVVPSRTEALGLVYLEAFAHGVPVVAGCAGGVTEIVRHRDSGMQTRTDGPDVAAAVSTVLADAALRDRLCLGGRREFAARTIARLVDATLAGYVGPNAAVPAASGA